MENDYTIININAIPETKTILPSDKIFVIGKRNDVYEKEETTIAALSSYFVDTEIANRLQEKYNELLSLSAEFRKFIIEKYPTKEYILSNYSKINRFNLVYNDLNSVDSIKKEYLDDFATLHDNELKKAKTLAEHEKKKFTYGNGNRIEVIKSI